MVKRCFEKLKNVKENEQDTDFSFVFVTFTIFTFFTHFPYICTQMSTNTAYDYSKDTPYT